MNELDKIVCALPIIMLAITLALTLGLVQNRRNPKPAAPVRAVKGQARMEADARLRKFRKTDVVKVGGGPHFLDGSGYDSGEG